MAINLMCPNFKCRSLLQVEESKRGQQVRCTKCGQVILVPNRPGGKSPRR